MSKISYLVTGAMGATGSAAVSALLGAGEHVRALAHREDERSAQLRRQGAEVIFGDLTDVHSVRAALRGVQRAYFNYPIAPGLVQAAAQFAQAAREAGVEAIVDMSQMIARDDAPSHAAFDHWLTERVFDWCGIGVTHLRPTFFAEWLLYLAPMIRQGTVYAPYGGGRTALISAEDQGRVIARILQHPAAHRGQTYTLVGPVEYTFAELAAEVGRVLGRHVGYQQVPIEMLLEAFTSGREQSGRNDALSGYA
ncbi:NmrA family NAD(P)-binding protein [Deinococcus ruber]|uniref:Nucleotide-diphosphate-sugar epimerase n=1 Tax=Deinococcus ruber TaxID=1848197 RepID=A0A918CFV2_9DEIO|nr:NmrA family NAD(P)-binding protein [Deinococcus ruber]GGR22127.1 nucleotide-diphosphate-sugar epimerase [Deinococcus ruber]